MSSSLEDILNYIKKFESNKPGHYCILFSIFAIIIYFVHAIVIEPQKIQNRISNLERISKIDINNIKSNTILFEEYNNIIDTIHKSNQPLISNDKLLKGISSAKKKMIQFVAGALPWWGAIILWLFPKPRRNDFKLSMVGLLLSIFFGLLTFFLPVIVNLIVSSILYFVLSTLCMFFLSSLYVKTLV